MAQQMQQAMHHHPAYLVLYGYTEQHRVLLDPVVAHEHIAGHAIVALHRERDHIGVVIVLEKGLVVV